MNKKLYPPFEMGVRDFNGTAWTNILKYTISAS